MLLFCGEMAKLNKNGGGGGVSPPQKIMEGKT